ncbi:MAG: ureidoglycolate lyase [Thermohalobaculum sp.]
MTQDIIIELLTAEAFAPFGTVIETTGAENFPINDATTTRFHALATADPGPEGAAILSIFRATRWPHPVKIRMLERHPLGTQAFFPLSLHDWLVVVAAGGRPGAGDLRLFRARGDQGVQYARGVWHHPLLILTEQQDFLVVDRRGPGDNLEEIAVEPGAVIESVAETGHPPDKPDTSCPFVYANGKRCPGEIRRIKAYGPRRRGRGRQEEVRKYRVWCTLKDDHAGILSSYEGKQRMEFYPDELPAELLDWAWETGMVEY